MPVSESDDSVPVVTRGFRIGPGLLVTAAFIGPGTVVTASKAGAERGCGLLWTILFACLGTIVLQSLAARVGIIRGKGLGESIRDTFVSSRLLKPIVGLVIAAIGVGNAAYQAGNLTGAVAGIHSFAGGSRELWLAGIVICACMIILVGRYRALHRILVALVITLSVAFLSTAVFSLPSATRIVGGLLIPRFGADDLVLVLALIGTTIVPYNLFLHASSAATTWRGESQSKAIVWSDWDTTLSVGLGGLVTASIVITASTAFFDNQTSWTSTDGIARQLEPTLGQASGAMFAIGLFAAGLTSSITAPLATSYAICGCLGWSVDPSSRIFRAISLGVVAIGGMFAFLFGRSPSSIIIFAQLANGLLLPIVAVFLLIVATRKTGSDTTLSSGWRLLVARLVVGLVAMLAVWRIATLFV